MLKQWSSKPLIFCSLFGLIAPCSSYAVTNISTCADLANIQLKLNDQYVLTNDIDCTGISFTPIGTATIPFTGSLDGAGYKVSNLTTSLTTGSYAGLFGVTKGAKISNLTLENVQLNAGNPIAMGNLVGMAQSTTITNISSFGSSYKESKTKTKMATSSTVTLGGLVGILTNQSKLSGSISSIDFDTTNPNAVIGGLVGELSGNSSISSSQATGHITGASTLGGLVGYLSNSSIYGSFATGAVDSQQNTYCTNHYNLGGLVGLVSYTDQTTNPPVRISDSYASGNVGSGRWSWN